MPEFQDQLMSQLTKVRLEHGTPFGGLNPSDSAFDYTVQIATSLLSWCVSGLFRVVTIAYIYSVAGGNQTNES